jgi:hypothetical protein
MLRTTASLGFDEWKAGGSESSSSARAAQCALLALPWLVLVMRFFFPDANTWLQHLPAFSGDQVRSTIVAVLLAASAYCLGAAVARLGQDFFDDDDLPLSVTESSIRVSVYCDELQSGLVQAAVPFQDNSKNYSSITPDWFSGVCQADG